MEGHIGDEKEDKPRSQKRFRELSITELKSYGFIQEIATIF